MKHHAKSKHRLRKVGLVSLFAVLLLLIGLRLALPGLLQRYVNRTLDHIQDYAGSVGNIEINLYRGAYKIRDLQLIKTNADIPVPFLTIPEMDLSVEWRALFHGALVGEVIVSGAQVNFVSGPIEEQEQTGLTRGWTETLDRLFPLTINRFQVKAATLRFANPHRQPPVDIYLTNLWATATNLTNVRHKNAALPAGLIATGKTIGDGDLEMELHLNPLAPAPTFKLLTSVTNVDLVALNNFLRAYGKLDAQRGRFALFVNVAAADEKFHGHVKPFLYDAKLLTWREAGDQSPLKTLWEGVVQGASEVFRNQSEDQLATTIPISGSFETGAKADLWTTIGGILRNAFVQALLPRANSPPVPLPTEGENPAAKSQPD
jgi:hypothetical protein